MAERWKRVPAGPPEKQKASKTSKRILGKGSRKKDDESKKLETKQKDGPKNDSYNKNDSNNNNNNNKNKNKKDEQTNNDILVIEPLPESEDEELKMQEAMTSDEEYDKTEDTNYDQPQDIKLIADKYNCDEEIEDLKEDQDLHDQIQAHQNQMKERFKVRKLSDEDLDIKEETEENEEKEDTNNKNNNDRNNNNNEEILLNKVSK